MMKHLPVRPPSWLPQPYVGPPLLLSKPDAARLLGIGRAQVRSLIADGRLQVVDIDGLERVTMRSIITYVEELINKRPAATGTAGESIKGTNTGDCQIADTTEARRAARFYAR